MSIKGSSELVGRTARSDPPRRSPSSHWTNGRRENDTMFVSRGAKNHIPHPDGRSLLRSPARVRPSSHCCAYNVFGHPESVKRSAGRQEIVIIATTSDYVRIKTMSAEIAKSQWFCLPCFSSVRRARLVECSATYGQISKCCM